MLELGAKVLQGYFFVIVVVVVVVDFVIICFHFFFSGIVAVSFCVLSPSLGSGGFDTTTFFNIV